MLIMQEKFKDTKDVEFLTVLRFYLLTMAVLDGWLAGMADNLFKENTQGLSQPNLF
jgi:hypothetical protein